MTRRLARSSPSLLVCLLLSFFFAGSETALTASSRARMHAAGEAGKPARRACVNRLLETRERMIGALLIGNNVVNIAASSLATGVSAQPGSATSA